MGGSDGVGRGDDGQPGEEQRKPSRADSLRLTRMPQIPHQQRITRTGAFPTITPPAAEPPAADSPAPEVRRSGRRRWGLLAAGGAVLVAIPAGLIAADPLFRPGQAVGAAASAGATASGPVTGSIGQSWSPSVSASGPAPSVISAPSPGPSASASPAGTASPTAVRTTIAPPPAGKANPSGANLALAAVATASDFEDERWAPRNAVDGDADSRWSSGFTDRQWLKLDLRESWRLSEIVLRWERAHAVAYRVETSVDGEDWKRVYSTRTGTGGTVRIGLSGDAARYVRMTGIKRSNIYGYSLYEVEVR